jgi:hypothetical protein
VISTPELRKASFPEARLQRREREVGRLEGVPVGPEAYLGPGPFVGVKDADPFEFAGRDARLEGLLPEGALAAHLDGEPFGERVDDRDAHAVEPPGYLVGLVVELPAGVELRHHHLHGRAVVLLVRVNGDAAPVVGDGDRPVVVDRHRDGLAVAGQRLVDSVVDHLVDQMVQPPVVGRPDVHGRSLANGLEPFQGLYLVCAVLRRLP